jgi:hypothetical protein
VCVQGTDDKKCLVTSLSRKEINVRTGARVCLLAPFFILISIFLQKKKGRLCSALKGKMEQHPAIDCRPLYIVSSLFPFFKNRNKKNRRRSTRTMILISYFFWTCPFILYIYIYMRTVCIYPLRK